jgi:hypothetical protein
MRLFMYGSDGLEVEVTSVKMRRCLRRRRKYGFGMDARDDDTERWQRCLLLVTMSDTGEAGEVPIAPPQNMDGCC